MSGPDGSEAAESAIGNEISAQAAGWKKVTETALGEGRLSLDPEGLRRCIQLCDDHARDMGNLASRARRELYVDALGIGEGHLESAQLLAQKFKDKAIGGGQIAHHSSAVGMFRAHESYAKDMKSTLEAVLRAYEEQEGITAGNLGQVEGNL